MTRSAVRFIGHPPEFCGDPGNRPNRLDELASLVSPFGQPRDSHHRRAADSYAPQIRIVKSDVPGSPRSPSSSRSGAPARTSRHTGHRRTASLHSDWVTLRRSSARPAVDTEGYERALASASSLSDEVNLEDQAVRVRRLRAFPAYSRTSRLWFQPMRARGIRNGERDENDERISVPGVRALSQQLRTSFNYYESAWRT